MDKLFVNQVLHGGTVVAASGDFGASGSHAFLGAAEPDGGLPGVEPVRPLRRRHDGQPGSGGALERGHYGGEQAWNELLPAVLPGAGAGGGAPSAHLPRTAMAARSDRKLDARGA